LKKSARTVTSRRKTDVTDNEAQAPLSGAAKAGALGPGIHAATLDKALDDSRYQALLLSGEHCVVVLGKGVSPALAAECMARQRTVFIADLHGSPTLLGALQTTPTIPAEPSERLQLKAQTIDLDAAQGITLRTGDTVLRLDPNGTLRIQGEAMTMSLADVLRVLSRNVELP
jgi:hypothetical protein